MRKWAAAPCVWRRFEAVDEDNTRLYKARAQNTTLKTQRDEAARQLRELAQQFDHLPDVSPEVPLRVRIFLSRTRTMCEGMRAYKAASRRVILLGLDGTLIQQDAVVEQVGRVVARRSS